MRLEVSPAIWGICVGNTMLTMALVHQGKVVSRDSLIWSQIHDESEYSKFFSRFCSQVATNSPGKLPAIISSVVPKLGSRIHQILTKRFNIEVFFVQPGVRLNFSIWYHNPEDVGSDRIANSAAAKELYGYPGIIVDSGTATSLSVLDSQGDFIGGAILPGLDMMASILANKTSLLPETTLAVPQKSIGDSTVSCIQSGVIFGYIDSIHGLITRFAGELGLRPQIIITGGNGKLIPSQTGFSYHYDPDLLLKGLEIIYKYNVNEKIIETH